MTALNSSGGLGQRAAPPGVWIAEARAAPGARRSPQRPAGVCSSVFAKASDYVIYSQCLAQLLQSYPLHTLSSLTRCGMWSHSASPWLAFLGTRFPVLELIVKGSTSYSDIHVTILCYVANHHSEERFVCCLRSICMCEITKKLEKDLQLRNSS